MPKRSHHGHPRGHHPAQALRCPSVAMLLEEQDRQVPHCPCKMPTSMVSVFFHPRDTGIILASAFKKSLRMASMDDCHTSAGGCTADLDHCDFISKTYSWPLKRDCDHQASLSGTQWPSPIESHQSFPAENSGSIYGHHCRNSICEIQSELINKKIKGENPMEQIRTSERCLKILNYG